MKKRMCLTLFMVAAMLTTNLTITPQGGVTSQKKASWKQQVRRNWACVRGPKKNNCSKQEVARARKWVTGASAAAIAAALIAAGIAIKIITVRRTQEEVNLEELRAKGEISGISPNEKIGNILANQRLTPEDQCKQIKPILTDLGKGNIAQGVNKVDDQYKGTVMKMCVDLDYLKQ